MKNCTRTLLLAVTIFSLAACSFTKSHSLDTQGGIKNLAGQSDTLLNDHQTHKLLKQWDKLGYSTELPNQKVRFLNKHPFAKTFYKIHSGYSVAAFAERSKGIGLPVVIQTQSKKFKPVSKKAYQSNIYPGTLIVTKNTLGDISIVLLDPRSTKEFYGKETAKQSSLVIDHITNDPNNRGLKLKGLINPLKYRELQGFYLSQPYDQKKIPLIMIHGIFSSPETFTDMAEAIDSQPDLYQKYQIWHYYYPTGTPWIATAHEFRTSYRNLLKTLDPRGSHANLRKSTIIAHSMGGLITRLSLSEPKDTLYKAYLGDVGRDILTKGQHKKLSPYFNYRPLTEPKQVIFLAVPHRGSEMASGIVGWATNKIISIPNILIKGTVGVILPQQKATLSKHTLKLLTSGENAVNQLQPSNPALDAMNQMRLPQNLKIHSIIGDIGPPGIKFYTDGVVTYRSSNLNGTGTETIVPSNHDITDAPEAIQRVIKILRSK